MKNSHIIICAILFTIISCGSRNSIPAIPYTPQSIEERSIVPPEFKKVQATIQEEDTLSSNIGDVCITNGIQTDIDSAIIFARNIRPYTDLSEEAQTLLDSLELSLNSAKIQEEFLLKTNNDLVNDFVDMSNHLADMIQLSILNADESRKWQNVSDLKNKKLIQLNGELDDQRDKIANLRLDLEKARTYQWVLITLLIALIILILRIKLLKN